MTLCFFLTEQGGWVPEPFCSGCVDVHNSEWPLPEIERDNIKIKHTSRIGEISGSNPAWDPYSVRDSFLVSLSTSGWLLGRATTSSFHTTPYSTTH